MSRLCTCRNPFDSQAKIVKWMIFGASRVLDRASNQSLVGGKPDGFRHNFRRVTKPPFPDQQRRANPLHQQSSVRAPAPHLDSARGLSVRTGRERESQPRGLCSYWAMKKEAIG
jgi:hypothetical protein